MQSVVRVAGTVSPRKGKNQFNTLLTATDMQHERVAALETQEQHRPFVGKEHQQFEHRRVAVNPHATAPPQQQTSATASQHSWAQKHRVALEERLLGSNSAATAGQHVENAHRHVHTAIGMHGPSNGSDANQSTQERAKAGWADGHLDMVPKTEPSGYDTMAQHPSNVNLHALALGSTAFQTIEHISQNGSKPPVFPAADYMYQAPMVPLAKYSRCVPDWNSHDLSNAVGDVWTSGVGHADVGYAAAAAQTEVTGHAQNTYAIQSGTVGAVMYAPSLHTAAPPDGAFWQLYPPAPNPSAAPTHGHQDQSMTRLYSGNEQRSHGSEDLGGNACQYLQTYSAFFPSKETLQEQEQSGKRACSYCSTKGHNVRTCEKKRRHDHERRTHGCGPFFVKEVPAHSTSAQHDAKRQRVELTSV